MSSQITIQECYDSFGLLRDNDVPCDPNAEVSACCGTDGSQCVDNLHCINPSGGSVPGTCTFTGWVSGTEPACPCPPIYKDNQTLDYRDGVTLCSDGGYCCGASNFDCCENGESKFIIDYGLAGDTIPATDSLDPTSVLSEYYADLAVSTQSITRATSSDVGTTSSTPTTTSSVPTSASTQESSSSTSDGLSTGAKAGIGVGVAALVILVVAMIVLFVLRRRRRNRQNTTVPVAQQYHDYQQQAGFNQYQTQPPVRHEKSTGSDHRWTQPSELDSANISNSGSQSQLRR